MKAKQFFGSIMLIAAIAFFVSKFKEHIPRSGDDWIWMLLLFVVILFIILIIRRILQQ